MSDPSTARLHRPSLFNQPARLRDGLALGLVARALDRQLKGQLDLRLPSGRAISVGEGSPHARVWIKSWRAILRCISRGTIGFAEGYFRGEIETDDLVSLFSWFIDNRPVLEGAGRGTFQVRGADKAYHRKRANTRTGSRDNISAHYDLGNDFYALWLDAGMAYSSGIYLAPDSTLEDAQERKYAGVLDALELQAGERVLEIGCGWGGFAEAAAQRGADVHAITISQRQLDYTKARTMGADQAHGLHQGTVTAEFLDYRDTKGQYDKVASIEMIEAVGQENWAEYFQTIFKRLRPGGIAAIQAITIRETSFDNYARKPDFIQRYIFPGGMLPTKSHIYTHAENAGLTVETPALFGMSYAQTLRDWREAFHTQWGEIEKLGFDARFKRMWDYYLTYCEAGFERGVVDVGIYKFRRPDVA
jgi:cyclopropane-fatty-acyl-phospholipid synthase